MLGTSQGMQSRGRCWLILWPNSHQLLEMHIWFTKCQFEHEVSIWMGESNARSSGIGIVLKSPVGIGVEHSLRLGFQALNNEAEYEALIAGFRAVTKIGATNVEIHSDSRLVVSQVRGDFEARDLRMADYLKLVHS